MPDEQAANFQINVTPEMEGGVYANFLGVWHTAHEFTLDFCSTQPAQLGENQDGEPVMGVPCRVVARVKIPPTLVFDILKALNENMTKYEQVFGEIKRPAQDADN